MLTDKQIRHAEPRPDGKPNQIGDGRYGLAVRITKRSDGLTSRRFVQQIRIDGKRTMLGLGEYPRTTLAQARDTAFDNLRRVRDGHNVHTRQPAAPAAASSFTFGDAWQLAADRSAASRAEPARRQHESRYRRYLAPLADKPIDEVTLEDIVSIVDPLWHDKQIAAKNVLSDAFAALEQATAEGHLELMTFSRAIAKRKLGAQPAKKEGHYAAVPYSEVPEAVAACLEAKGTGAAKAALLFGLLTTARQVEVRRAEWSEFTDRDIWAIPAEKMKKGSPHNQPLTAPALRVLEAMRNDGTKRNRDGGNVFPKMHTQTVRRIMADCGLRYIDGTGATPHGFWRSSFMDWALSQGFDFDVANKCLAHKEKDKVRAAYARSERTDERRELLNAWSNYCMSAIDDHDAIFAKLAAS